MLPKPVATLEANTAAFEVTPLVKPTGFREYDARWLFPQEINLLGVQTLGLALGTYLRERGVGPKIAVGHDYRAYSLSIKQALTVGLMSAGCDVFDIGLALSPVAYFSQFALDVPSVAMVTASHNENGWTGVKMGCQRPVTFGPEEMTRLKELTLSGELKAPGGGSYTYVPDMRQRYIADLTKRGPYTRRIKAVVATGNGTAGHFAPEVLSQLGIEVVPLHTGLDYTFPHHNPNPEDLEMLHAVADAVKASGADVGLAFDGDGDRCGVVDERGEEIFADKIGVMLARDLSAIHKGATFVADVKSTGLFLTDPVLKANGAKTEYWKTGHSYIKRRTAELGALAGFEKSGHFFFNAPIGRGYDDGLVAAIAFLDMMERNPGKTVSQLYEALPHTYGSPTMAPYCADERKYEVVEEITAIYRDLHARGETIDGKKILALMTVNGVRVTLEDGTWGLVRASSNKPSLVVVVESPVSKAAMVAMFRDIEGRLAKLDGVGEYDQKI